MIKEIEMNKKIRKILGKDKKFDIEFLFQTYISADNEEEAIKQTIEQIQILSPSDIRSLIKIKEIKK